MNRTNESRWRRRGGTPGWTNRGYLALLAGVLLWAGWGSDAAAQPTVQRGPFLQQGSHSSMVVVWETDAASAGVLRYGTVRGSLDQSARSAASGTRHEVRVDGLSPETCYVYSVGTASSTLAGGTADYTFCTSPRPGPGAPVRLWVAGDTRKGGATSTPTPAQQVLSAMMTHAGEARPRHYLNTGDIVDDGEQSLFDAHFFSVYRPILRDTVSWPVVGNHDTKGETDLTAYLAAYALPRAGEAGGKASGSERYYSFDLGPVHVVALDSWTSSRKKASPMLTWLAEDLKQNTLPWVVAFWHHPPYIKSGHNSDEEKWSVEMRENALPILEAGGLDLALFGHAHLYARTALIHGAYETPTPKDVSAKLVDKGKGDLLGDGAYVKGTAKGSKGAVYVVAGHGGADPHKPAEVADRHPLTLLAEGSDKYADNLFGSLLVTVDRNVMRVLNLRADGVVSDRFTLVKGKALVLATPDGGERYTAGDKVDVRWKAVGASAGPVKVELSLDGGKTFRTLRSGTTASSHRWTVGNTVTSRGVIRVSSESDSSLHDQSDGFFSVGPKTELIALGAQWRHDDAGKDHGTAWLQSGFDDSAWKTGKAQLGYGDGDETTKLTRPTPRLPSVYFRKEVTVPAAVKSATLTVVHDDGAAVWFNGRLVWAEYMDNGTDYGAWASKGSEENERSRVTLGRAEAGALKPGKNVVAVIVKQVDQNSSDLSFDLELKLVYDESAVDGGNDDVGAEPKTCPDCPDDGCKCTVGAAPTSFNAGHALLLCLCLALALLQLRRRKPRQ